MARRRRNSGAGRKYAPAIKEQMNVVRLMKDDLISMAQDGTHSYTGNLLFAMLINAGLGTYVTTESGYKYVNVTRNVRFKILSAVAQPGLNIELAGTGESFINNSTEKPMKVKIPKNDLLDSQWLTIPAGSHQISDVITGSIGNITYSHNPFGGRESVLSAGPSGTTTYNPKDFTFECLTVGYCFY